MAEEHASASLSANPVDKPREELNGRSVFRFQWEERGGPPVSAPERRGFGSVVLEQVMAEYFDQPPKIEFAATGVKYELNGTLESLTAKA